MKIKGRRAHGNYLYSNPGSGLHPQELGNKSQDRHRINVKSITFFLTNVEKEIFIWKSEINGTE